MSAVPPAAALIVAAGRGTRAGGDIPKQYRRLAGLPVLRRVLEPFLSHPAISRVLVVVNPDDRDTYTTIAPQHDRLMEPAAGAGRRQDSVRLGLRALRREGPERVLIHDGARPFVSSELITRVAAALATSDAVVPALPVSNTLKAVDAAGRVTATVPREGLYAAETPQGFRYSAILAAHEKAERVGLDFTDDAAVAEWAGMAVSVVAGEPKNLKLTTAADFAAAERNLAAEAALAAGDIRIGHGYDVHAFGAGDMLTLGGVAIPHGRGLIGHSDADVVLHALTDAILGALADGDIGVHFPPADPQWRGASSDRFLAFAAGRVAARGGRIAHLDIGIVAEEPKIAPHREAMRVRIAAICGITTDRVAVKATTSEGLGFIGRGEGIAATATATVRLPNGEGM